MDLASLIAAPQTPAKQGSTLADMLKRLMGGSQGNSSPSVFDAKAAAEEHKRRLQAALEGRE